MHYKTNKGFTLIEVVIATFIVGVALVALAGTIQVVSKQTARVEEIFIANLIASNTLAELQLREEWPEIGEQEDNVEMAHREWFIEFDIIATEVETLRRVEVSVGLDDDRHGISGVLVGFVSNSSAIASRPIDWLKLNESNEEENTNTDEDSEPTT